MKKGVFSSTLIKKHLYWPMLIKGALIDLKMILYAIGKAESFKGTLDNIY